MERFEDPSVLTTTSGGPALSRFATTGIDRISRAVHDHSAVTVRSANTGVILQVSGSGCGRHWPSVGSQKLPGSQSYGSAHAAPGTMQAFSRHTLPLAQHVVRPTPQRTLLAHAGRH